MGLLKTTNNYDYSTEVTQRVTENVNVTVHEHKAITDEAVKYMEEAHNKAISNILAKVRVEDNIINGEVFLINQPWNINDVKIYCKFKVNGTEYTVEKLFARYDFLGNDSKAISELEKTVKHAGEGIMLWWMLKHFCSETFKKITGHEIDVKYIAEHI